MFIISRHLKCMKEPYYRYGSLGSSVRVFIGTCNLDAPLTIVSGLDHHSKRISQQSCRFYDLKLCWTYFAPAWAPLAFQFAKVFQRIFRLVLTSGFSFRRAVSELFQNWCLLQVILLLSIYIALLQCTASAVTPIVMTLCANFSFSSMFSFQVALGWCSCWFSTYPIFHLGISNREGEVVSEICCRILSTRQCFYSISFTWCFISAVTEVMSHLHLATRRTIAIINL